MSLLLQHSVHSILWDAFVLLSVKCLQGSWRGLASDLRKGKKIEFSLSTTRFQQLPNKAEGQEPDSGKLCLRNPFSSFSLEPREKKKTYLKLSEVKKKGSFHILPSREMSPPIWGRRSLGAPPEFTRLQSGPRIPSPSPSPLAGEGRTWGVGRGLAAAWSVALTTRARWRRCRAGFWGRTQGR